jgi:hypothetical protein
VLDTLVRILDVQVERLLVEDRRGGVLVLVGPFEMTRGATIPGRPRLWANPLSWLWNGVRLTFRAKAIRRSHRVEKVAPIKNSR